MNALLHQPRPSPAPASGGEDICCPVCRTVLLRRRRTLRFAPGRAGTASRVFCVACDSVTSVHI